MVDQSLQQTQSEISSQQEKIKDVQSKLQSQASQLQSRANLQGGLAGRIQREKIMSRIGNEQGRLSELQSQLSKTSQEVQQSINQQNVEQSRINTISEAIRTRKGFVASDLSKADQEFVKQTIKEIEDASDRGQLRQIESEVGRKLTSQEISTYVIPIGASEKAKIEQLQQMKQPQVQYLSTDLQNQMSIPQQMMSTEPMSYASPSDLRTQTKQLNLPKISIPDVREKIKNIEFGQISLINPSTPTLKESQVGMTLPQNERYLKVGEIPQQFETRGEYLNVVAYPSEVIIPAVVKPIGKKVEVVATVLNIPTLTYKSQEQQIPQRSTITSQGFDFVVPKAESNQITVLSPQGLGATTEVALYGGLYSVPYLGTGLAVSGVSSGVKERDIFKIASESIFLGGKGVLKVTKPDVKIRGGKTTLEKGNIFIQPVAKEGEDMFLTTFKVIQKTTPVIAEVQTPLRNLFGLPPKEFYLTKGRKVSVSPPKETALLFGKSGELKGAVRAIDDEGILRFEKVIPTVQESRTTRQVRDIFTLASEPKKFTRGLEEADIAEVVLGRPIPRDFASDITKGLIEKGEVSTSVSSLQKIGRINPKTKEIQINLGQPLKVVESTDIIFRVPNRYTKRIESEGIKAYEKIKIPDGFEFYKGRSAIRSTTPSRVGKEEILRTDIFVQPSIDLTPKELNLFTKVQQNKVLPSKDLISSVQKTVTQTVNILPKAPSLSLKERAILKLVKTPNPTVRLGVGLPRMVGGQGVDIKPISKTIPSQVISVEQGLMSLEIPQQRQTLASLSNVRTGQDQRIKPLTLDIVRSSQSSKEEEKQLSLLKNLLNSRTSQTQISSIREDQRFNLNLAQPQISKLNQGFVQEQRQNQLLRIRENIKPPQPKPPKPPIKKPPFKIDDTSSNLIPRQKPEVDDEGYAVFGKVKGEDVLIGEFETQKKAELGLKKFLKGTLGASGVISREGQELEFEKLGEFQTNEFRSSKKQKTRVVQQRKFRLSTGAEVSSIQRARRIGKKGGRVNWFV